MSSNTITVSRTQLYEQVWTEPMNALGRRYGVAASELVQMWERLNIPRPRSGYWSKAKAGKAPPRPELPEADERTAESVAFRVPSDPSRPWLPEFFDEKLRELYVSEWNRDAPKIPAAVTVRDGIAYAARQKYVREHKPGSRRAHWGGIASHQVRSAEPAPALLLDVSRGILDRVSRFIATVERACVQRGYGCRVYP